MSAPESFPIRKPRSSSAGGHGLSHSPYGSSPTGTSPLSSSLNSYWASSPPQRGIYGSSPPSKSSVEKNAPHSGAKKWWKRLKFDAEINPEAFVVGFIESVEHPERRSGVEAWSLRVHHHLVEQSYPQFAARFSDSDVPFHRIAYFRQGTALVWESEQHKRQQHLLQQHHHHDSSSGSDTPLRRAPSSQPPCLPTGLTDDSEELLFSFQDLGPFQEEEEYVAPQQLLEEVPPSFSELPDVCWHLILSQLRARDLCACARICRSLRSLAAAPSLWHSCHETLFGVPAPPSHPPAAVRRACRRSELRAARWVDAEAAEQLLGFSGTGCLQLDDSKVVSGDGSAVRLWSHATGRRIATLQGHTGQVQCVAFNEEHIVSGDCQGVVRAWSMDELRGVRTLRGHHGREVTCCGLLGSMPVSGGRDGTVCLWDVTQQSQQPVVMLEAAGEVCSLAAAEAQLVTAGRRVEVWDLGTALRTHVLKVPAEERGEPRDLTHVSYCEPLVAAGCAGKVMVWDNRTQTAVGVLDHGSSGAPPGGQASTACVGVQLDEWKLVAGFSGGCLGVYDMRAAGSVGARQGAWLQPVMRLEAPAPVTCFQFYGQRLLAGLEASDSILWTFDAPSKGQADSASGATHSLEAGAEAGVGAQGEKKGRKKGVKVYKKDGKFPKRKHK